LITQGVYKMSKTITRATGIAIAIGMFSFGALAGPDWIEDGDAGSSIDSAQDTTSVGVLRTIGGTLGGIDQVDCYQLIVEGSDDIANPVNFGFLPGGDPTFNPALWLFDSEGYGVLGNDDDPILGGPGSRLFAPSTDGVTLMLPPGIYILSITESGNVPLSMLDALPRGKEVFEEIFFFESLLEVSGPDGIGANNPLAAWSGGAGSKSDYGVSITPAPSTTALVSIMGLGLIRRRR
jgi:hypothetical protein